MEEEMVCCEVVRNLDAELVGGFGEREDFLRC